jgi:xylulokinase
MSATLAVDLGTTRVKAALYAADGSLLASAARNREVDFAAGDRATQDVELGWRLQCELVAELRAKADAEVGAIVTTHQRGTFAPARADGTAIGPYIVWMDRRGVPICNRLEERFGTGFYDRFLIPVIPYTGLSKLIWSEENGAAAPQYLPAHTIHASRMTGAPPLCDPSSACFIGPWDFAAGEWDAEFCGMVGLPRAHLPPIAPSTTVVGGLAAGPAAELGLPSGIPVVLGAADGQAAAIGAGCTEPGVVMINVGTATGVQAYLQHPIRHPDRALSTAEHALPGHYEMEGHTQAAAAAFDWFRATLGAGSPAEAMALAATAPLGADGVMVLPTMNGVSSPVVRPEGAASIHGLKLRHGRAHLMRALLEGLCFEIRWLLESLEKAVGPPRRIVLAGGMTQVDWFAGVLAAVLGRDLARVTSDPALSGISVLAAMATGADPAGFVRYGTGAVADPAAAEQYDRLYRRFLGLTETAL